MLLHEETLTVTELGGLCSRSSRAPSRPPTLHRSSWPPGATGLFLHVPSWLSLGTPPDLRKRIRDCIPGSLKVEAHLGIQWVEIPVRETEAGSRMAGWTFRLGIPAEGRRQERDENPSLSRWLKSLTMEFRYLRAPFGNQWIRALVDVEACLQSRPWSFLEESWTFRTEGKRTWLLQSPAGQRERTMLSTLWGQLPDLAYNSGPHAFQDKAVREPARSITLLPLRGSELRYKQNMH